MSLRVIEPTSLGPRPRPSSAFPALALAALNAEVLPDDLPASCAPADKINGVAHASGHSRIRHCTGKLEVYPTGLLAPGHDDLFAKTQTTPASTGAYWDLALNGAYFPYNDLCILGVYRWHGGMATAPAGGHPSHFFQLNFVTALAAANQFWQILIEPDPVDTLTNAANAINNGAGSGVKWEAPDEAHASYRCLKTADPAAQRVTSDPLFAAAVVEEDTLRIYRKGYGDAYNDELITLGTRISFDESGGTDGPPAPSEPAYTGAVTSNPATSNGYWPTRSPVGTVAHVQGYSGSDADFISSGRMEMWDAGTGTRNIWKLFFTASGGLGPANQFWQVEKQGTTAETMEVVDLMFRGIPDTRYVLPNLADPSYTSVGIEDWEFHWGYNASAGAKAWFVFRTKTTGERKNRADLYQNCWIGGIPDPLFGTTKQCEGGSDPILDTRIGLETPGPGNYIYRPAWYRKGDIARSGFGEGLEVDNGDGGTIIVGGYPTPADPSVDYLRLFRSLQEGLGDFFKVKDIPLADDPFTDDFGDKEIAGTFGSLLYNPREYRHRGAGYPPKYQHLIRHLGSVWGAGISRSAPQRGTAAFTKDSDIVTVAAPTVVTARWIGRYIGADDSADTYRVVLADTATGEVTLGKPYEGETEAAAAFSCIDGRRSTKVGRAEPGLINQWPTAREFHGIDTLDELGVTAMAHTKLRMFLWTRDSTWVLQGSSPTTFSLDPVADGIGALNHRCMVVHNGVAYWLEGPEGFYAWAFEGIPQRVSNPPFSSGDEPLGIQDTVDRINWDATAAWGHGLADPDGRRIRWWVCVDGSEIPNMVVCLDLKSGSWATETCEGITAACRATKPDGSLVVLAGDVGGRIWELDQGDSDGVHDIDPVIVLETAGTTGLITCPVMALSPSSEGAPFLILHKDGTTESGIIADVAGKRFLTPYELLEQAPAVGDVLIVGGIDLDIEPNRFHQGVPEELKSVPMLWIYTDQGEGEYYLWVGVDNDELAVPRYDSPVGSAAAVNGIERFRINQIGHQHGFRLRAFVPGTQLALRRFTMQTDYRALNEVRR